MLRIGIGLGIDFIKKTGANISGLYWNLVETYWNTTDDYWDV